ncbi:hypothetical protein DO021_19145 [Desulfobacter hydrogenophilus]|uniref:PAS domain S-box protein n=1 Tax=Desulfobacter hydrogenophilus TaxID=2291 RepID=A0A328F9Q9_9BACT|nr:PAS domain S-box protein [Desulfobacter hydrogenophilus]NDY74391.1 PAS domain S-box protein [Desulfobacter hydrogenophilus]QBH14611.1 PAS domain S-box protein [Desulfobacter hydrogenophilus]RAM00400.1 hypothetical protein DO021_19145 [Desulfobacter hydrogenophilus]
MPSKPSYEELKQSIKHLKQQNDFLNRRYRAIIDNSMDAILLTALDGQVFFANQAACELFQMTEAELIKGGRLAVVDVEDPRLTVALEERMHTGKFRGELNYKKKDGTIFPVEISSVIFKDADGTKMTSMIVRDATERRILIQEIKRVNTLLERVYSSLDEAVFVIEPETRMIISCNDAAEKIFGYSKEEMLGKDTDFLHTNKKTYHKFGKKVSQVMEIKDVFQMEFNLKKKDGSIFPTVHTIKTIRDNAGVPVMHVSVVKDISFLKKTTERLQKNQKELQIKAEHLKELNTTLKVLLDQRDQERKNIETQLSESVYGQILPYIDRIKKQGINDLQKEYIKILEFSLKEMIKPYNRMQPGELISLTPAEIRVSNLTKQGYRIKEIALKLNISPRTVEFHRDNIRKKLEIKGKKINLKTYLSHIS